MAIWDLLKVGTKKAAVDAEKGLILMLEKLNCGDIVDEHQLLQHENALETVSKLMVKAQATYEKEDGEYKALKKAYDEKLSDAEKLQTAVTTDSNLLSVDKKAKFEQHLIKLIDEIEAMKPRLETEEQEMIEARDHFALLKETVEVKAKQLAEARTRLTQARTENQRLDVQVKRQEEREAEQKVLMGIRTEASSMDTVLNAIDSENQKKREQLAASKARVDALKLAQGSTGTAPVDSDVADFLKSGTPATSSVSVADRLAALKK